MSQPSIEQPVTELPATTEVVSKPARKPRASKVPKSSDGPVEPPPPTTVVVRPDAPTQEQFNQAFAKEVADDYLKKSEKKNSREDTKVIKQIAEVLDQKASLDPDLDERARVSGILNAYREKYYDKIPKYPWKKHYSTNMSLDALVGEQKMLDDIINSSQVEPILTQGIIKLAEGIQLITKHFFPTEYQLHELPARVAHMAEAGTLDSEIDQLTAQYANYFTMGPKTRLAFKITGAAMAEIDERKQRNASRPRNADLDSKYKGL